MINEAAARMREPIQLLKPLGTAIEIPIPFAKKTEEKTKVMQKYESSSDLVFSRSLSEKQPLKTDDLRSFIESGKEKTMEFIENNGSYANAEDGKYAQGWVETFDRALGVLSGERKNTASIHKVIDSVCQIRESRAKELFKKAIKRINLERSEDSKSLSLLIDHDIEGSIRTATTALNQVKAEVAAVQAFVKENWPLD